MRRAGLRRLVARRIAVLVIALLAAPSRALLAQGPGDGAPSDDAAASPPSKATGIAGSWEVWGGLGGKSPQWGLLGETPHMRLGLLALRWTKPLGKRPARGEPATVEWTVDLVPVARLSPPLVSLRGTGVPCPTAALCVLPPEPSGGRLFPPDAPLGAGISPIGVTRRFFAGAKVSPWIGITGGALIFGERVPTTKASRFNFTATADIGLRFGRPSERGLTLAYRFHHLSNAGTAGENPGVASHLVTVGLYQPRR